MARCHLSAYIVVVTLVILAVTNRKTEALFIVPTAAVAGLITGTIGTVLTSLALGLQLGGLKAAADAKKMMKMHGYGPHSHDSNHIDYSNNGVSSYSSYKRRRRSTHNEYELIKKKKLALEKLTDKVYKSDRSQCVEKMFCQVTKNLKMHQGKQNKKMLKLIESDLSHGLTYRRMLIGKRVGAEGGDCEFLFDSCPFDTDLMINYVMNGVSKT